MAPDGEEEATQQHPRVQGLAEGQSASTAAGPAQDPEPQGTGTLQLLSGSGKRQRSVDVLQGGGEIVVQVVESTESKAKPDLAEAERRTGTLCVSASHAAVEAGGESGACVSVGLATRVSMFEEPGAGKPHAGICAGGAG